MIPEVYETLSCNQRGAREFGRALLFLSIPRQAVNRMFGPFLDSFPTSTRMMAGVGVHDCAQVGMVLAANNDLVQTK